MGIARGYRNRRIPGGHRRDPDGKTDHLYGRDGLVARRGRVQQVEIGTIGIGKHRKRIRDFGGPAYRAGHRVNGAIDNRGLVGDGYLGYRRPLAQAFAAQRLNSHLVGCTIDQAGDICLPITLVGYNQQDRVLKERGAFPGAILYFVVADVRPGIRRRAARAHLDNISFLLEPGRQQGGWRPARRFLDVHNLDGNCLCRRPHPVAPTRRCPRWGRPGHS